MWVYFILYANIWLFGFAQTTIDSKKRITCSPSISTTEELCVYRGCIWDSTPDSAGIGKPNCYFPQNTGYITEDPINNNPLTLKKSSTSPKNPFGQDFDELIFQTKQIGSGIHISITPKGTTRYIPPIPVNPSPNLASSDQFSVVKTNDSIFSFAIQRQSSGTKIWDTSLGGLLFADKFLQIASYLPSDNIYGFGENVHTSLKHDMSKYHSWGMWARDGETNLGANLYGVHPFYMGLENDGKAHGVFLFNSNAQDITLGPAPHLVYRTIGGQFDIFYFPGPTPEEVIQQYLQVIGKPAMPAYWALGFHLCRNGYAGTKDMQAAVNRTINSNIPFDVAWADGQYMDSFKMFTLNMTYWSELGTYTDYLHTQNIKVILSTNPGIEVDYDVFQRGLEQNVSFVEWPRYDMVPQNIQNQYPLANGTKIMLGCVWPSKHVAFPDFWDPTGLTIKWWISEFARFRNTTISMDGLWMDMDEPTNFGTTTHATYKQYGQKWPTNEPLSCPISGPDSGYDAPPYYTYSGYHNGGFLASVTLCMCGVTVRSNQTFYDTKNLYGLSVMVATAQVQKQAIGKRGADISRSTFPSSGVYGGHWTGDNHANWNDLQYSIIALQEFNLFGIPFVGADVCGFHYAPSEELCLRWQQLGAFYPFFRNHNDWGTPPQDPGIWPAVAAATRKSNLFRYRHLPYLYSLLFNAALNGGTVFRPVFFEFPNDPLTYGLSFQFMWGPALIVIPVIGPNATSVAGYLPTNSTWYSMYDYFYGNQIAGGQNNFTAPSTYLIPTFVRGGYILPRQKPSVTTTLSRLNEMQLLITLDTNGLAKGELYWDDGDSVIDDINTYSYYYFVYNFVVQKQNAVLNITLAKRTAIFDLTTLDNLEIFGYPYTPNLNSAKLNGNPVSINTATSSYSPFTKILNITTTNFINLNINRPSWILTWDNQ